MNEIDRHLAELAKRQHQVFSREQAAAAGLNRSAVSRRVRSGLYVALGTNSLCFAGTDVGFRGRLTAGLFDLGPDALVSGRSAAALLELDGFNEGPCEYLVPRDQRHRTVPGVVTSSPDITRLDRTQVDGIRCTSGTRTVVQLILTRTSEREVGNALDSGSRRGLTAPSVVQRRLDEMGTQGRPGIAVFNRVMESAGVQSWLERQFLSLVKAAGLPKPALQRTYRADGEHIARVDFDFAPTPVVVEVGGRRGYLSLDERRRQERRRNALQLEGRTIYFFTTEDVIEDGSYVIDTVRRSISNAA